MAPITVTIDPFRVLAFGNPDETLAAFCERVMSDARMGAKTAWTDNAANVGTINVNPEA